MGDGPEYVIRDGRIEEVVPPTPELLTKGGVEREDGQRGGREIKNYASDVLGYYHKRSLITAEQMHAGKGLSALYERTRTTRYVTMRFGDLPSEAARDAELRTLRWIEATRAIRASSRRLTVLVCCEGALAGRGRMLRLRDGLDDLVGFWERDGGEARRYLPDDGYREFMMRLKDGIDK